MQMRLQQGHRRPRPHARHRVAVVVACLALAACGSKTEPNEKNFGAALSKYLEAKGRLCLGAMRWPYDMPLARDLPPGYTGRSISERLAALEAAGLVRSEEVETLRKQGLATITAVRVKVLRYSLTDAASPFAHVPEVDTSGRRNDGHERDVDLCWGRKQLDKVVKWEGPLKLGDHQVADVVYTYAVSDVAEWARLLQVQAAYPSIRTLLDGAGTAQMRHGVTLTSAGWEAKGMN